MSLAQRQKAERLAQLREAAECHYCPCTSACTPERRRGGGALRNEARTEVREEVQRVQHREQRCAKLEAANKDLQLQALREAAARSAEERRALEEKSQRDESRLDDAAQRNEALQRIVDGLRQELERLAGAKADQYRDMEARLNALVHRERALEERLATSQGTAEGLEAQLAAAHAEHDCLRTEVREEVQRIQHREQRCAKLEAANKDLQLQVDENSEAGRMFEEMQERYVGLEEAHEQLKKGHAELMELNQVNKEIEILMQEEIDQHRLLAQTAKEEVVMAEEELIQFRERDAQQRAEIERLARTLEEVQQAAEAGRAREASRDMAAKLDLYTKVWQITERQQEQAVTEDYKNWVIDLVPPQVINLETPVLDCQAAVSRALHYAELLQSAAGDLLSLHCEQSEPADRDGFSEVRRCRDVTWVRHDRKLIVKMFTLHMRLHSFVLRSFRSACNRTADDALARGCSEAWDWLVKCECAQKKLLRTIGQDNLAAETLVDAMPQVWSMALMPLWELSGELLQQDTQIESCSLLLFLLAILEASELFKRQLKMVSRYLRMHQHEVGLREQGGSGAEEDSADMGDDAVPSDEGSDADPRKEAVRALLDSVQAAAEKRREMHQCCRNLYKELKDAHQEQPILLDKHQFEKLKLVLNFLLLGGLRLRPWLIAMHERAVGIRNGTVPGGFFSAHIISTGDRALRQRTYKLSPILDPSDEEASVQVLCCDPRHYLAPLLFASGQFGQTDCIDDYSTLTEVLTKAAHVSRMVLAALRPQYLRPADSDADSAVPTLPISARARRAQRVRSQLKAACDEQCDDTERLGALRTEMVDVCSAVFRELSDVRQQADSAKTAVNDAITAAQKVINGKKTEKAQQLVQAAMSAKCLLRDLSTKLSNAQALLHKKTVTTDPEQVLKSIAWGSEKVDCEYVAFVKAMAERWGIPQQQCNAIQEFAALNGGKHTVEQEAYRLRILQTLHLVLQDFEADGHEIPAENACVLLAGTVALGHHEINLVDTHKAMSDARGIVHDVLQDVLPNEVTDKVKLALHPTEATYVDAAKFDYIVRKNAKKKTWMSDPALFAALSIHVLRICMWHPFLASSAENREWMAAEGRSKARKEQMAPVHVPGSTHSINPRYSMEGFTTRMNGKKNAWKDFLNGVLLPLLETMTEICPTLSPAGQVCAALLSSYE